MTEGPPHEGTALRLRIAVPGGAAPGANTPAVLERLAALEARFLRR